MSIGRDESSHKFDGQGENKLDDAYRKKYSSNYFHYLGSMMPIDGETSVGYFC